MRRRTKFDWDEGNLPKIRAHQLSKFEVESALTTGLLFELDTRTIGSELRHVVIGRIPNGRPIVAVWTLRKQRVRVITAYPMNREERERHELT